MIYSSADQNFEVSISEQIVEAIRAIIKSANGLETGGILIGRYSPDHKTAIINHITGPPKDSKAGSTWFVRGVKGLETLLKRFWSKNEYYLGEWHYHPNASASPSMQDISQMKEISRSIHYQCPEPVLLIIGGDYNEYEIRVFVSVKNYKLIKLKTATLE